MKGYEQCEPKDATLVMLDRLEFKGRQNFIVDSIKVSLYFGPDDWRNIDLKICSYAGVTFWKKAPPRVHTFTAKIKEGDFDPIYNLILNYKVTFPRDLFELGTEVEVVIKEVSK